jgi:hypothetical protein
VQLGIDDDARALWERWYNGLPENSPHTRRLDTIGFRLLALIALTTDKLGIDVATVGAVTAMLDYELRLRRITDPIDAENKIAELEEAIRRNLQSRGALTPRELRQRTSADRKGLWAFNQALENLRKAGDVAENCGRYEYAACAAATAP